MRISDWSSDVCSSDLGHVKQSKPIPIPAFPLKGKGQKGVALLTVLLLVAVMSVLVMGMLDDIRFGLRRASNAQAMAQAQWYALGAESLAMAQIDRLSTRRSEEHTSELQSLMRISYAVFCLTKTQYTIHTRFK